MVHYQSPTYENETWLGSTWFLSEERWNMIDEVFGKLYTIISLLHILHTNNSRHLTLYSTRTIQIIIKNNLSP